MTGVVVIGSQWGDEGKGKIVDWLSSQADVVIRFQGGHNAGHTLVIDGETYKLNIFTPVPQKLLNFSISDRKILEKKETKNLIESYKQELASDGRIFERMSGTEPVLRVMIECSNHEKLDYIEEKISSYFSKFN